MAKSTGKRMKSVTTSSSSVATIKPIKTVKKSTKPSSTSARIPQKTSEFSANWKLLAKVITPKHPIRPRKPKPTISIADSSSDMEQVQSATTTTTGATKTRSKPKKPPLPKAYLNKFGFIDYTHYGQLNHGSLDEIPEFYKGVTNVLAIDCEMVGVGPMKEDALARVSIVNEHGFCLLDTFVKPKVEVTDYRTEFSGVREEDLLNAMTLSQAMSRVCELIKGKILVGHSVDKDLSVLYINHPLRNLRDTAKYFRHRGRSPSLKMLAERHLKVEIQTGEHSSIQDAQATMKVYLMHQKAWEKSLEEKRFRHR